MFTYQNGVIRTSVRRLVEFLLRQGDIISQGSLVADTEAMQAGSRIHRKIQKNQAITYQAEVPLKMEWEQEDYRLILEGRADGIDQTNYGNFMSNEQITMESYLKRSDEEEEQLQRKLYYIDEIKGIFHSVKELEDVKPLHLAQAKCYAAIYMKQKELKEIGVQITYCNMETEEIQRFHFHYKEDELQEWYLSLIDSYKMWADCYMKARNLRQETIKKLTFPFDYREGQKKLIAMVYHSILQKKKVFFQAPTGIGKTISTIYPSLKVLSEEKGDHIYYLTAKTITRTVAEDTLKILEKQGLRLKTVTLTAKEKLCPNEVFECNPQVCKWARGHFDRINEATYQLYTNENAITREMILGYAMRYEVCPYQLSFEVAAFCDFVICDYNYVFDPMVNRSYMANDSKHAKTILLVDEAHNLVERAREMYSAILGEADIKRLKKILPSSEKALQKKLNTCNRELKKYKEQYKKQKEENPDQNSYHEFTSVDSLYFPLFRMLENLLDYLTEETSFEDRQEAVEIFFRLHYFQYILETMTEGYRIYGIWSEEGFFIRLYCIDPSSQLKEILERNKAAIFFSATLLPMPYYRNLLYGEEADAFAIPSPFDSKKRLICITNDVTSRYSRRNEKEYGKILDYILKSVLAKKGNYMVFFPSYEMMEKTYGLAVGHEISSQAELLAQQPSMAEEERERFLAYFQEENERALIGFCVLGSIFSEGIDLSGQQLIGVFIVGTGLPKIGVEPDIIRSYFDNHDKKGYDYAYRYPGMNKVLQAAGRVIRSTEDVGVITLMDDRFLWRENQYLLPEDWDQYYEVNLNNYSRILERFWKEQQDSIL